MQLMISKLVSDLIANVDPKTFFSQKELNKRIARRMTRAKIKRELVQKMVEHAATLPNFDETNDSLSQGHTGMIMNDFFRRATPFILPEYAHEGVAYVLEHAAVQELRMGLLKPDD